jgi:hypothetical protein
MSSNPVAAVKTPENGPLVNPGCIHPGLDSPCGRRAKEHNDPGSFLVGFRLAYR